MASLAVSSFARTRVLDVDLAAPLPEGWDAPGCARALVLLRWRRQPIAQLTLAFAGGRLGADALRAAVAADDLATRAIARRAVRDWLLREDDRPLPPPAAWTVIVCTRDRPDDLARCLEALGSLTIPSGAAAGEILVVDNAPSHDGARRVVEARGGAGAAGAAGVGVPVRYVREDRPGLNWARARGAREARGELVAYTDDDVVVDPEWLARLLAPFADRRVGATTGLAMPLELETEAQWLFERYGGFGRGFEPRVFEPESHPAAAAGVAGAGANMAFRRALVTGGRLFDVELDAGTVTLTGGDTWALSRVLDGGHRIVYAPDALVWHRHRREREPLRRTLYGYSVGGFAFLTRRLVELGDVGALRTALQWLRSDHVRLAGRVVLRRPTALPADLVLAYWRGVLAGPVAYLRSRPRERRYRRLDAADAPPVPAAVPGPAGAR